MSTGYLNNGEDYLFKLLNNRDEKCIEYVSTNLWKRLSSLALTKLINTKQLKYKII